MRRDLADVFATRAEGVKGRQAVEWGLVDAIAPRVSRSTSWSPSAPPTPAASDRPDRRPRRRAHPLDRRPTTTPSATSTSTVVDRPRRGRPTSPSRGPGRRSPSRPTLAEAARAALALAAARQLDDAILRLRFNEPEVGTWVPHRRRPGAVLAAEDAARRRRLAVNEMRLLLGSALKRLDLSARTLVALVEPGSCFAGTLAELALAADRSFMLDGDDPARRPAAAALRLTEANHGWFPMANGLSRLATRFWGATTRWRAARGAGRQGPAPPRPPTPGSSRSPPTTSTGTTRCA